MPISSFGAAHVAVALAALAGAAVVVISSTLRLPTVTAPSLYVAINKRIKLRFGVTVALITAGGHQSTIRPHLRIFRTLSRSPRKLCVSPTFICVEKRSNLETCIADTNAKYF